jgi:hypothetical protein
MKVHHSLATYHGGAADMNKRCAVWLPTFLQRGIHFFGERTEVLAFNNSVLFDRVHLPIIGKRAAVVEEDSLSVREPRPRKDRCGFALISDVLPFGRLWYGEPNAITNAIGYAKFYSRSRFVLYCAYRAGELPFAASRPTHQARTGSCAACLRGAE